MEAAGGGGEGGTLARARVRAGHAVGRAAKLTERAIDAFFKHRCSQLAASISYYALLSLFPAAIVTAAVFGIVIGGYEARSEVVDFLFDTLPLTEDEGRRELERTVNGVTRNTEALGLVGLVVLLYSASALWARSATRSRSCGAGSDSGRRCVRRRSTSCSCSVSGC